MTEHEYSQTEQRRTEGTAGRRYQHGGRASSQWDRQGGQWSQQGGQTGQQSSYETGSQMGQQGYGQTSYGTGGRTSQQSSGQQTSGQQSGSQQSGGQQSGSRMGGGQTGGSRMGGGQQTGSRMGGGQGSGGQMHGQTGGQMSSGQMGGQTSSSQMGRGQTGGQMGGGQTSPQTGQMGGQSSQQAPIKPVTVSDVAASEVVTVQPDAPVSEIVQRMSRENVGSVVVAEGNRPVGIVTDRKVALALGETQDVSQLRATDLMSEDLVTVPEGANVFDLVRRLSDEGVRRVPVISDRGDLTGIVSLDDVIVLLAEEFYNVSELVRKQSPRF